MLYFGQLVGVGDGLAIVVEGETAEIMSGEFVRGFGLWLKGARIGQHFLKIIEITLIIKAIRTLSYIPNNRKLPPRRP